MKVNMNQMPDEKRTSKKPRPEQKSSVSTKKKFFGKKNSAIDPAPVQESNNNVYKEALKGYANKVKSGSIFQQNKFWIIILVILFLAFISVNSKSSGTKMQLTVQLKRATTETEKLNNAIAEVKADLEEQAKIESVKLTDEEEDLARNNAIAQGKAVELLQNQYRTVEYSDPKYKEIKAELSGYFDENTDGTAEWYIVTDNFETGKLSGIPGKWEFASNASFKGNTTNVLWLCYADDPENPQDHSLLAYCTARYNADTKLFSNLKRNETSYAEANRPGNEHVDADQSMSLAEQLQNLANNNSDLITTPDASENFSQDTIDTNNEISENRQSYKDSVRDGEIEGEEYDHNYDVGLGKSSENESEKSSDTETEESSENESENTSDESEELSDESEE